MVIRNNYPWAQRGLWGNIIELLIMYKGTVITYVIIIVLILIVAIALFNHQAASQKEHVREYNLLQPIYKNIEPLLSSFEKPSFQWSHSQIQQIDGNVVYWVVPSSNSWIDDDLSPVDLYPDEALTETPYNRMLTVFIIMPPRIETVGHYTRSNDPALRVYQDVIPVQWPTKKCYALKKFVIEPPSHKSEDSNFIDRFSPIERWINSLSRR